MIDVKSDDIIVMRKKHPCGCDRFKVLGVGMDFKLECLGCGHELIIKRAKALKNIKNKL